VLGLELGLGLRLGVACTLYLWLGLAFGNADVAIFVSVQTVIDLSSGHAHKQSAFSIQLGHAHF